MYLYPARVLTHAALNWQGIAYTFLAGLKNSGKIDAWQ